MVSDILMAIVDNRSQKKQNESFFNLRFLFQKFEIKILECLATFNSLTEIFRFRVS